MKKLIFLFSVLLGGFGFTLKVSAYEGFVLPESIIRITNTNPYQIEYTGDLTGLEFSSHYQYGGNSYGSDINDKIIDITPTGKIIAVNSGIAIVDVNCVDRDDSACNAYIGGGISFTVFVDIDSTYTDEITAIIDEINNKIDLVEEKMNTLDKSAVRLPVVPEFMDLSIDMTSNDIAGKIIGTYRGYGNDFISYCLPSYEIDDPNVRIEVRPQNNKLLLIGMYGYGQIQVSLDDTNANLRSISVNVPKVKVQVDVEYATGNASDKETVLNFAKDFPIIHKNYINLTGEETSLDEVLNQQFEGSTVEQTLKDNNIFYYFDPRMGDGGMQPFVAGQIALGKNDIYYTAKEIKIWSVLRLPKMDEGDTIEGLQKYFDNLYGDMYDITVENSEEYVGYYTAFFKEKEQLSFFDKIINFFIPTVYADEIDYDFAFSFALEEAEETNNPKTGDSILNYISLGALSTIGLVGCGIYLSKHKKKN